jgi:putative peptidoglycan lipid II flippase
MAPALVGIGIYYVDSIVAPNLLSRFGEGSVSYFNFAFRLCDLPQGIFVMALSSAALPSLSLLAAKRDYAEVGKTFAHGMRLALFVAIPATLLFVVLSEPLVVAVFQRGKFQSHDAIETARALAAQSAGIWMVACVRQLLIVLYALEANRFTVFVSAIDFGAFLALGLALRGPLGHVGVSVALTGSNAVQMILLWVGLGRRLPDLHAGDIAASAARTLAASAVAAVGGWAATRALGPLLSGGFWARLVPGLAGSAVFVALFFAGSVLLKSTELAALGDALRRRRTR